MKPQAPPPPPRPTSWAKLAEREEDMQKAMGFTTCQSQLETSAERKQEAKIMFLQKFQDRPMSLDEILYYESNQGWLDALGKSPLELKSEYEASGLIEELNTKDHLRALMSALLTVAALKESLALVGCKKSGNKVELIDRLIEADRGTAIKSLPNGVRWGVTEKGSELVNAYRAKKKDEKEWLEDKLLELASSKRHLEAATLRAEYNARQVFPPGLGCSWDNWDTARDVRILESISSLTPEVLSCRSSDALGTARLVATLSYLMGSKLSSRLHGLILRNASDCLQSLQSSSVHDEARLLEKFAIGKANLDEWRASADCKFVRILDAGDDSCQACKAHSQRKYAIEEVPQLPSKACTHPIGCRCSYVPD